MENIEKILEKLMLNRTALLMKKFDKELKEILDNDLEAYKQNSHSNNSNFNLNDTWLVA